MCAYRHVELGPRAPRPAPLPATALVRQSATSRPLTFSQTRPAELRMAQAEDQVAQVS